MEWNYYKRDEIAEKFDEIVASIQAAAQAISPSYLISIQRFLDEANTIRNNQPDPQFIIPPTILKLANTALNVAGECYKQNLLHQTAYLSNLACELYINLRNPRYDLSVGKSMALFVKVTGGDNEQQVSLSEERRKIEALLTSRNNRISPDAFALVNASLLDVFTTMLSKYQKQKTNEDIRQFLENNFQAVWDLDNLPNTEQELYNSAKSIWQEAARHFTPELYTVIIDQVSVTTVAVAQAQKILSPSQIEQLTKGIQSINIKTCYDILKPVEPDLIKSILEEVHSQHEIMMPLLVSDFNPSIQQQFDIAIEQNKKGNLSGAIQTLNAALEQNPGNQRLREWIGAIYLKSGNLLRAKKTLEHDIQDNWRSLSRSWNLAYIYKTQGDKQKAFDIFVELLENRKSRSVVYGIVELAVELKHTSFLVKYLSYLPHWEACALGFLYAKDNNSPEDVIENYLIKLDNLLSLTPIKIPALSKDLSENEIQDLTNSLLDRGLNETGILYFEERLRRNPGNRFDQPVYYSLGKLYQANSDYSKALEFYRQDFELVERSRIPLQEKREYLLWLLDFCVTYKLPEEGLELLNKASYFGIYETKITAFERKFKEIQPQQPSISPNESSSSTTVFQKRVEISQINPVKIAEPVNNSADHQALTVLLDAQEPLRKISTLQMLIAQESLVNDYCIALKKLYSDEVNGVLQFTSLILAQCQDYSRQSNNDAKSLAAQNLLQSHYEFEKAVSKIENDKLLSHLAALRRPLRHAAYDAGRHTDRLPKLGVQVLNQFLSVEDDLQTTILIELTNESEFDIVEVEISLRSVTGGFEVVGSNKLTLSQGVSAKSSQIAAFKVIRRTVIQHERLALEVIFSTNSIDNIPCDEIPEATLPIRNFKKVIKKERLENPYITLGSIPSSRPENFHGREEIIQQILNSFAGGESRAAPFLSGIRRIGKTSILQYFLGNPPPGMLPVLIRIDVISPRSTGEFLFGIARLIYGQIASELGEPLGETLDKNLLDQFEARPSLMFSDFLEQIYNKLGDKRLLLMFDEFQVITEAIRLSRTDPKGPKIDIDALDITRGHIEQRSFSAILTGSLLFEEIRDQVEDYDRLWGSVKGQDIPFLTKEAVKNVLNIPAQSQNVTFPDATIERVWHYTQGYPVFVQLIGSEVFNFLNQEQRTIVSPEDIDIAAKQLIEEQDHQFKSWWDIRRLNRSTDEVIIKTILDQQALPWSGISIKTLVDEVTKRAGTPEVVNQRLGKLLRLNILGRTTSQNYRINALILEKWLQHKRHLNSGLLPFKSTPGPSKPIVGIFVDHENIFFGLEKMRRNRPNDQDLYNKSRIQILPRKLLDYAETYGEVDVHFAIADWYQASHIGPQQHERIYIQSLWDTKLPKMPGPQQSDHELRDMVHEVFDDQPEINTYILVSGDGDFSELAAFLIDKKKRVIIWSLESSLSPYYSQLEKWGKLEIVHIETILDINPESTD